MVELIAASVVIATRNRAAVLRRSLESLGCQSVQPAQLILVDGSDDTATRELCCEQPIDGLASAITWLRAATIGAARQRNQGIPECQHSVVGFFDDDILFEPACLARLWKGLQSDPQLGGVNAFIVNQHYQPPGLLSRAMFRAMSGQAAASYAGRVLGPAVNLLPEDRADLPELVATEWLNTTCTLYRHAALPDPPFPSHFSGYSMMEDLALSLKVGRRWKLANARAARIYHDSQPGPHKNDVVSLSKMEIVNRHYVMTNVLRRRRLVDYAKLSLWEGFQLATCAIQKRCGIEFWRMLGGKILGLRDIIRSNMSHKAWHEVNASSDIGSYHIDGVDNSNPRVAVIIPTFNGNARICNTLRRIKSCNPPPDEIWIHIDGTDGTLDAELTKEFPDVHILSSKERMGPGGGRHRCLVACSADYAVSFDDDSYPIDIDFFAVVSSIFLNNPRVAVLEAKIWHRGQSEIPRRKHLERTSGFTGCGHAIRTAAYRALPGYLSEPISYNAEEVDLSFQLWGADWQICRTGELRVFHDTNLSHHQHEEIVAGALSNTALVAFLNYPMVLWPYAALQVGNRALFCIRGGRTSGLLRGLAQVPLKCYRRRHERRPLPLGKVVAYLRNRN